jgi:hypothetical protein
MIPSLGQGMAKSVILGTPTELGKVGIVTSDGRNAVEFENLWCM